MSAQKVSGSVVNDRFIKDAAQYLQSGNAALFLLIRKMTADKVLAGPAGRGGTVIRTSFDEAREEALRTALAGAAPSATPPAGTTTSSAQPAG